MEKEHFTKTKIITVEMTENIIFFFAKTPFSINLECQCNVCYKTNDYETDKKHYPLLTDIGNIFLEIFIDKNEYQPISFKKCNNKTKANLIPKFKPKLKWKLPIIEKDGLIIKRIQKRRYINKHDDDYLHRLNNIESSKKGCTQSAK